MPILHLRHDLERSTVDAHGDRPRPGELLVDDGPRLCVVLDVTEEVADALARQGRKVPRPVEGWGLLDTGASRTCVDSAVARELRLPVVGWIEVTSATTATSWQKTHPIRIRLEEIPFEIEIPCAIAAPLEGTGLVALIGRDVLRKCAVFYDGIPGRITLSW